MDRREALLKHLERLGPYIGGLIALIATIIWYGRLSSAFAETGMSSKDTVNAVFNVMVTLTAFLFSVFVLAIAPGGGFIERIFKTATFRIFKRYVVEALIAGAIAALASVPFMSTPPGKGVWRGEILASVWVAIAVTALLSFLRVVHLLIHWLQYDAAQRKTRRA